MLSGLIQQLNNYYLPQEVLVRASFYLIAGLTVVFALLVVISRNIFHCAIFLAMVLLGTASAYLFLDAEFLAVAQILIYVGAILILFIFAIMLTANIASPAIKQTNSFGLISAVSALGFLLLIAKIIKENFAKAGSQTASPLGIGQLGRSLMTTYVLPFEAVSLILVAVLVGAIVIARQEKK